MDKWEKVFKYAVYMAYEIVGYARCPDSAAWERTPMKMFNLVVPEMRQLRKQVDVLGGGIRQPVSLHVFAGEDNLLETWNVRLTQHDQATAMKNPTYNMSKTLLELSIFLRSLQSLVGVLPASIRSNRHQGESYNITLSKPGKKSFRDDAIVVKYQFKSLHSILGVFQVEVLYRKNVMDERRNIHTINEAIPSSSNNNMSGNGNNNNNNNRNPNLGKTVVNDNYIPGPTRLTRVKSDPRQIPTNINLKRNSTGSNSSTNSSGRDVLLDMRVPNNKSDNSPVYPSSYAEGTARRRFGSFGDSGGAAFSVGTPPLHPSSLGSNYGNRSTSNMMMGNNRSRSNSNITQFSPGSATPPAFASGSFKSGVSQSPFNNTTITGSSPPFSGMYMANRINKKGGATSVTPVGIKTIKPTPSPPTYSYFTSPYASFMSGNNSTNNMTSSNNLKVGTSSGSSTNTSHNNNNSNNNNNDNSQSDNRNQNSNNPNIGEMSLHSPWGTTLGVVAKRAGKECQYGAIDTTWIAGSSVFDLISEDLENTSSSTFVKVDENGKRVKKKKDKEKKKDANNINSSSSSSSSDSIDNQNKSNSNVDIANSNIRSDTMNNNDDDDDDDDNNKEAEGEEEVDIDVAAFAWYDNGDDVFFADDENKVIPTSLDTLNLILKDPRDISITDMKPIKQVIENATGIVENAKRRLQERK